MEAAGRTTRDDAGYSGMTLERRKGDDNLMTSHELKNAKRLLSDYNELIKIALVNDAGALGLADTIPFCCPPFCRKLARKYAKDEVMHINRAFTEIPPLEHCLLRLLFIENVSVRVVAIMLRWKIKRVKKYEVKALADFIEAYRELPKNADERAGCICKNIRMKQS